MTFTTDTATARYYLAKYFDVQRLQNEAKAFCLHDMQTSDTCATYYLHASMLQAESILQAATKACHDNIRSIDPHSSDLMQVYEPQLWLDVMGRDFCENFFIDRLVTGHVAIFCHRHAAVMSTDIFEQLTDRIYLGGHNIDPVDAVRFLDAERRVVGNNGIQGGVGGVGEGCQLSSLQTGCVRAISSQSSSLCREAGKEDFDQEWIRNAILQLPPFLLCDIIVRGQI